MDVKSRAGGCPQNRIKIKTLLVIIDDGVADALWFKAQEGFMPTHDFKARRVQLGLSRSDIAQKAHVDKRIMQLLELNQFNDEEVESRVERALSALENDKPLPDFAAEVEAIRQRDENRPAADRYEN